MIWAAVLLSGKANACCQLSIYRKHYQSLMALFSRTEQLHIFLSKDCVGKLDGWDEPLVKVSHRFNLSKLNII